MCEPCKDVEQLLLYFTHEKQPDKYQYSVKKIVSNFDIKNAELQADKNTLILDELVDIAKDPHGKVFCGIMDKLNACGWNIRISHHSTENGESSTARKTYRPGRRLIGVFIMKQEIYYAVINPGYVGRIVSGMFSTPDFRELKWYVSNDDYFKQFPLIRSLRGYKINKKKLSTWPTDLPNSRNSRISTRPR